jgi:hypothetical protein
MKGGAGAKQTYEHETVRHQHRELRRCNWRTVSNKLCEDGYLKRNEPERGGRGDGRIGGRETGRGGRGGRVICRLFLQSKQMAKRPKLQSSNPLVEWI